MEKIWGRVKTNWQSGLTVALVSIPLSISLAIASGASPIAGIITAVWAGLFAAIFGGSHFNVVGPAGALTGILAAYALTNGAGTLPLVAIVAGILTLIAWTLKLERFLVFVPGSTIHGFTLGVAVVIASGQLNSAFGLTGLTKHKEYAANLAETFNHVGDANMAALIVFAVCLATLFALLKLVPKIPGAVILAPIGIIFGYLVTAKGFLGLQLATIGSTFPGIKATLFMMPEISFNQQIFMAGAAVAFVAILETMLSAKIADGMTKTLYNERKEMFGLGLANIASGLAGGLPATGVLVRTAINAKSGANHKTSSGLNAIFVGVISLVLFYWFSYLPMAVIAAILIYSSVRMVAAEHFKRFWEHDKLGFWIAMLVAAITVFEDPILGLAFGTAASLLIFMDKVSRGQFEMIVNDQAGIVDQISDEKVKSLMARDEADHILVYSIKGQLAYINSQAHLARFRSGLNGYKAVVLRLRELHFIDLDGVEALTEIIEIIENAGVKVFISGLAPAVKKDLHQALIFQDLEQRRLVFAKTADALRHLRG